MKGASQILVVERDKVERCRHAQFGKPIQARRERRNSIGRPSILVEFSASKSGIIAEFEASCPRKTWPFRAIPFNEGDENHSPKRERGARRTSSMIRQMGGFGSCDFSASVCGTAFRRLWAESSLGEVEKYMSELLQPDRLGFAAHSTELPLRAVISISIFISGSINPATTMVAAGMASDRNRCSTGWTSSATLASTTVY